MKMKRLYLVALPTFPGQRGFCHPTVLVRATDKADAASAARSIRPDRQYIGDIKEQ